MRVLTERRVQVRVPSKGNLIGFTKHMNVVPRSTMNTNGETEN